jgi:hypothetical protein
LLTAGQNQFILKMKRLSLMIALVAVASTVTDAGNYFPQEGKRSKAQTIKAERPMKKVARIKAVPIRAIRSNKSK